MDEIVDMTKGVYRRIYAGALRGRRICSVSVGAEMWFWRLNLIADDFGNCIADPKLIVAEAAGRRSITPGQAAKWTSELVQAGLATTYTTRGETYLHIEDFERLQPCTKNGRRIRRHPGPENTERNDNGGIRVNPGESGGIQGDPGAPSPSPSPSPKPIPIPIPIPSPSKKPKPESTGGPGRAVHAQEGGLRAGQDKMAELDRSIGRSILRKLRWADGPEGHLHAKTIEALCKEPGCDGPRVWWLKERLRTAEADNPASFVMAGIKEAWDVPADAMEKYREFRAEKFGDAVRLAQAVERQHVGGVA